MEDTPRIVFKCLEVRQPIGTFYLAVMEAEDLIKVSYADVRRLEERDLEKYLGIQRTLNAARVQEIAEYVKGIDATFPTGVILAVPADAVEYNEELGVMSLPRQESIAKIIDGQHRIAGLKGIGGRTFQMNVTLFLDMELEHQAQVFATINLAQTKVSKSLAYDLFELAKTRSPQKTAHNIARLMNREAGSPFYERIKILGVATPGKRDETLTQAAFVERLLPMITSNALSDRELLKRGKELDPTPPEQARALIFREMFRRDEDSSIALELWNYFSAVQRRWPWAWNTVERGNLLNRTTGFAALMRVLPVLHRRSLEFGDVPSLGFFEPLLASVKLKDSDFTPDRFKPGTSGEAALAREIIASVGA